MTSPRRPCQSCPWKRSTPRGGFPGGKVAAPELIGMESGEVLRVMQCHATTDEKPRICVGFARRLPDTIGVRIARMLGVFDPAEIDQETPPLRELHTLPSLLITHGSSRGGKCPTRCPGCLSTRCSSESTDDPP